MLAFAVVMLSAVITAQSAQAQTFTTQYSFADGTDGGLPKAGMIQGTDGNLYGTTSNGGANADVGTVFKITPGGALTTVYSFCAKTNCVDGAFPYAGVVQATNGDFYGTTYSGGANNDGTVFKVTPGGVLTTLYSFCSQTNCADGKTPHAGVVQATNGDFYGTTENGGANNDGTVYKITPAGVLTTLHSFDGTDGNQPIAGVIQATDGNLYGTASLGGSSHGGTVFKMTPSGALSTLYNFCSLSSCADGEGLFAGVVQASDGNFYGATVFGGTNNDGTVYKLTPAGVLTTLHSFDATDGQAPMAPPVQATDGNLYGTTGSGGVNNQGTAFEITLSGTLTTLYNFCSQTNCVDGEGPQGGLVQITNGNLYGITYQGGANNFGTVFSLAVGLGGFVELQSTSGKEGVKIGILGQGFSSSSVVAFGGTHASTIARTGTTFIKAMVPAGALTGAVTVTTGATTLTSPQTFKVLPTITSIPSSGAVGTPVAIEGTGLTQTTKVTFGGVKATSVTVNSDTQVTADIPTGAKTGKIAVTTKGGSATSKTSFTVN